MREFLLQHWIEGFFTVIGAILSWLGLREIRRSDEARIELRSICENHNGRLITLEKDRVTRQDFDELRTSMMASFTNMADRIDKKMGDMHGENRETLRDIHHRVDDLWKYRHGGER